jgi:hypothetical protein
MEGDGFTIALHCETLDITGEGYEPDASPIYCAPHTYEHEQPITNLRVKLHIIEAAMDIVGENFNGNEYDAGECLWALACITNSLRNRIAMATDHDADHYLDPGTKLPSGEIV